MMRRAPRYVQGFVDQYGRARFYFRRPGFKRVPLPGLPWSPEFMAAYEEAFAGQPMQVASGRVRPGTFRALAVSYFGSRVFRSLKPITQSVYRNIIERFCNEADAKGHKYGDKQFATLQREHVVRRSGQGVSPQHRMVPASPLSVRKRHAMPGRSARLTRTTSGTLMRSQKLCSDHQRAAFR
jgi:hypothetical protein